MLLVIIGLAWLLGHGAVALARPAGEGWRSGELFHGLLLGLGLASWLGQALADLGWFSWWRMAGGLGALAGGALALAGRRALPGGWRPPWREAAALGGVLLVGAALFGRPGEITVGGRDDGIRLLAGVTVARQGGWLQRTPLGGDLPRYRGPSGDLKYLGFLLVDEERELVVPQFTGVHEVWQAIAYGWPEADPTAAVNLRTAHPWMFWLNPLMAVLALAASYALGREIGGHWGALTGAGLLAISMPQIWYARLVMAEIIFQIFLLGGLAACCAYARRPGRVAALTAGVALGVAALTKVDGLIGLGALAAAAVAIWPQRGRWPYLAWLAAPLAALCGHYVAHALAFSGAYLSNGASASFRNSSLPLLAAAGVLGLLGLIGLRLRYRARLDPLWTRPWPRSWRLALLGGLLAAMGYAYLIRPGLLAGEGFVHPVWNTRIFTYRGLNFRLLVAYLTPLAALLALGGLARWLLAELRWHQLPFLAAFIGYGWLFTFNAYIVGDQPFWVRRFLPLVIPGALLLAGIGLEALWRHGRRGGVRWAAPVLLAGAAAGLGWNTAPIAGFQTGAGLGGQLQRFAGQFPPHAVVLFEDSTAGFALSAPLEIAYGREAYQLEGAPLTGPAGDRWLEQLRRWADAGRPVFYVAATADLTIPASGWRWQRIGATELRYEVLETTHDRLPQARLATAQPLTIYRLEPGAAAPGCQLRAEIGGDDYGLLGSGWYAAEDFSADSAGRWSEPDASIIVPRLAGAAPITAALTLGELRPTPPLTATVRFRAGGRELAALPLTPGWHTYQVAIPTEALTSAATLLEWSVPGWSPQDAGSSDVRRLGLALDSYTLTGAGCQP